MSTAQWGDGSWGEVAFGDGGGPIAHAVSARGAVNTAAFADRLANAHAVTAQGSVASSVVSIGYGPGAIHPITATGTVDVLVSAPNLRFSHVVTATGAIDVLTDAAYLRHQHHPSALGTVDTSSAGTLSALHVVSAQGIVDALVTATVLNLGHPVSASGAIDTLAFASESADIPTITLLPVIGVVNLITNPAAASTLEGWAVENGAILDGFDTDHVWFGNHSVAVSFHNPAVHERLIVSTPPGLGIVSYPGSILWGTIVLAAGDSHNATANIWTRAHYSDSTIDDGDPIEVAITATGVQPDLWQTINDPFLILNPGLALEQAWVVVEILTADAFPFTLYIGGAQVEYDALMTGPGLIALEAA